MDLKEKIAYWLDIAQYDLDTADATFKSARYLYTAFMCQQAAEKMMKAVFLSQNPQDEPPRSHNLTYLLDRIGLGSARDDVSKLAGQLTAFYIETRYPNYKEQLSKLVDRKEAEGILNRTTEAFSWLKSRLP